MGQYFQVVNISKKEMLYPFDVGSIGLKLTEWANSNTIMVCTMMNLMAGRWKGDVVFVVGDYAADEALREKPNETPPVWEQAYKNALQKIDPNELAHWGGKSAKNIYDWSDHACASLYPVLDKDWRYVVNHAEKVYIDLAHCPERWDGSGYSCAPLPILLAMGNGLGGGDYYGPNMELAGSWCDTVQSIEVTNKFPSGDYMEIYPNFTEG